MSLESLQRESELLFDRHRQMPRLAEDWCSNKELMAICRALEDDKGVPFEFSLALLSQMELHRQADVPTLVGCLRNLSEKLLGRDNVAQEIADWLSLCVEADLVDWDGNLGRGDNVGRFVVAWTVGPEVRADLARYGFPLPMLVPPNELKTNRDTGYLEFPEGSVILGDKSDFHEGDVCLDHLNRMNGIKLRLDLRICDYVKNVMKVSRRKPGESEEKFRDRKRDFEKFNEHAWQVFDRFQLLEDLDVNRGKAFHLTHKVDFRGRIYCVGHYVTYQGNDWCKALIAFDNEERVEG